MYNKKFIVMTNGGMQSGEWTVLDSSDDFQEAYKWVSLAPLYYPGGTVMIVSPVKFTVLPTKCSMAGIEEARQLDLFEEAQS